MAAGLFGVVSQLLTVYSQNKSLGQEFDFIWEVCLKLCPNSTQVLLNENYRSYKFDTARLLK